MLEDGIMPSNARHAVARKMLTAMWAMWKTNSRFDDSICQKPDTEIALASSRLFWWHRGLFTGRSSCLTTGPVCIESRICEWARPVFCYASIICMDRLCDESRIGVWRRFYDCLRWGQITDVRADNLSNDNAVQKVFGLIYNRNRLEIRKDALEAKKLRIIKFFSCFRALHRWLWLKT